ncbi:2-aminoethylphosphonate ABC transporter substrate-binding protein [Phytohabitans flavus]|uniref:2-aminoethylphosphonate ABC transporter substrate-binding protein n=2 Tax=Phytohabitans flavus TaxID=1076124 RepID=A0A6F8XVS8_9ACTN|nr:2-aminoethylphosphonate ABC transporter substrate-binding protein [Phytohabitans flavus]
MSRRLAAPLAILVIASLAACGGDSEEPASAGGDSKAPPAASTQTADQLYQAAKDAKEDKVVVYASLSFDKCFAKFEQSYPGIKVEYSYLPSDGVIKVQQEVSSGRNVGDVAITSDEIMLGMDQIGVLQQFLPSTTQGIDPGFVAETGNFMAAYQTAGYGLMYNKTQLTEDQIPTSYEELADPKFKGKIGIIDPTTNSPGNWILRNLLMSGAPFDDAWLKRFVDNEPGLMNAIPAATQAVATGEYAIMIGPYDVSLGPRTATTNKTLGFYYPIKGPVFPAQTWMGMIDGAPHPNAAKLFETWFMGVEGQTCMTNDANKYPVMQTTGIPPAPPIKVNGQGLQSLAEMGAKPPTPPKVGDLQAVQEYIKKFKDAFGR